MIRYVEGNHRESLAREITHIHFPNLILLSLENNDIKSIEGLARVDMAHL